jgi:hypothetical protein
MNIVLIPSIIDTPKKPLSYCSIRSVYSKNERFEQTKLTVSSVRERLPNSLILMIECSLLTPSEFDYFNNNVDIFINIYDNPYLKEKIHSSSKSMGEGTMTLIALEFLKFNKIGFKYLFKLSGRYRLNEHFEYSSFDNENIVAQYYGENNYYASTILYKLPFNATVQWYKFLLGCNHLFLMAESYEHIFSMFLHYIEKNNILQVEHCKKMGVCGNVAVGGGYIEG